MLADGRFLALVGDEWVTGEVGWYEESEALHEATLEELTLPLLLLRSPALAAKAAGGRDHEGSWARLGSAGLPVMSVEAAGVGGSAGRGIVR